MTHIKKKKKNHITSTKYCPNPHSICHNWKQITMLPTQSTDSISTHIQPGVYFKAPVFSDGVLFTRGHLFTCRANQLIGRQFIRAVKWVLSENSCRHATHGNAPQRIQLRCVSIVYQSEYVCASSTLWQMSKTELLLGNNKKNIEIVVWIASGRRVYVKNIVKNSE